MGALLWMMFYDSVGKNLNIANNRGSVKIILLLQLAVRISLPMYHNKKATAYIDLNYKIQHSS